MYVNKSLLQSLGLAVAFYVISSHKHLPNEHLQMKRAGLGFIPGQKWDEKDNQDKYYGTQKKTS